MPETTTFPGNPFCTPEQAVHEIASGGIVIVVDDENRENEGDLIMAAEFATEQTMAFFVRHTSGVVCVPMPSDRADDLDLPLMVPPDRNADTMGTAFTVSVDLRAGITTGISAAERAATVRALARPGAVAAEFTRPGHVFPLRARPGGVLERPGHTEAAVDLARLAGVTPVGVSAEVVRPDGQMARLPDLLGFAREHGLLILSIADLARMRLRQDNPVRELASARLPTEHGEFTARLFETAVDGGRHIALTMGDVDSGEPVLARLHSECLTGDVFGSLRCDCGEQLDTALRAVGEEGRGVIVYLQGHEGRGIGLGKKLAAYALQEEGADTVEANLALGLPVDARDYRGGAGILAALGATRVRLLTNNPGKAERLAECGLEVLQRVPLDVTPTPHNMRYLTTKRRRMGHLIGIDTTQPALLHG